ncbi:MAG: hypothetical protein QOI78_1504, partial [Actinomycetota bacterium]|nr:hypothetical protein [Actinomycetota bacterium]
LASFNGPDWIIRKPDYPHLLDTTGSVAFPSGRWAQRTSVPVPLTTGLRRDGKPAFIVWTSHGLAGTNWVATPEGKKKVGGVAVGRRSAELIRRLALGRGTRQLVFTCYAAAAPEGGMSVAQQVADEHIEDVETVGGTVTVSHGRAPGAELRLVSKQGDAPGEWQSFRRRPAAARGSGEASARLPLAGQSARYRSWYGTPLWKQVAAEHELVLGEALDKSAPLRQFVREFAEALAASGTYQVSVPADPRSVSEVMTGIDRAVRQVHPDKDVTLAIGSATQDRFLQMRGLLLRVGPFPSVKPLLRAYKAVAFPIGHRVLLAALIGWQLRSGTASLAEILGDYVEDGLAEDGRGMDLDRLKDAVLGDAVDLYDWARSALSPFEGGVQELTGTYGGAWLPPHHRMYSSGVAAGDTTGIEVPEGIMAAVRLLMPADTPPAVPAGQEVQLGAPSWAARHAAVRAWAARRSGSPLDHLLPAHLTALFVGAHAPDHRLISALSADELSGRPGATQRLADELRDVVDEALAEGSLDFPYALENQPEFRALADEARRTGPMDDRYEQSATEIHDLVASLLEAVRDDVDKHRGMLAEALAALPATQEPVYFGYWAPGVLETSALGTLHSTTIQQYRAATADPATVLDQLDGEPHAAGSHRVVVRFEGSPARDVSFAAQDPALRQALFPWKTRAAVQARGVLYDDYGRPYEYQVAAAGRLDAAMDVDAQAPAESGAESSSQADADGSAMDVDSDEDAPWDIEEDVPANGPGLQPVDAGDEGADAADSGGEDALDEPLPVAAHEPRYPLLFTGPGRARYAERSAGYARAVGRVLAADPMVVGHVQQLIDHTLGLVQGMHGADHRGWRGFLRHLLDRPTAASADLTAAVARLRDKRNPPPLAELVDAFARIAPQYAEELHLPAPAGVRARGAAWTAEMTRRGYRVAGLTGEQAEQARQIGLLLGVYRHLNMPDGDVLVFREALAGWILPREDALPLEWFLDASHRAGVRDEEMEPDPWQTDLSRVHGWVHGILDPTARLPLGALAGDKALLELAGQPPHVAVYQDTTAELLAPRISRQSGLADILDVLGAGAGHHVVANRDEEVVWRERRAAFRDLLRTLGSDEPLSSLNTGHAMALTVASGPDSRFLQPGITLERLRELIQEAGQEGRPADPASWPLLMLRDPAIGALVEAPGADFAARTREAVDAFAAAADDALLAEVRQHTMMATEAMALFQAPAAGRGRVWYWTERPGPLFTGPEQQTAEGAAGYRAYRLGTSSRQVAMDRLDALVERQRAEGRQDSWHVELVEVERPLTVRDTAMFSRTPDQRPVQSPEAISLQIVSRTAAYDPERGVWYAQTLAKETAPPEARVPWQREILRRELRTPDGTWYGTGSFNARDIAGRHAHWKNLQTVTDYFVENEARTLGSPLHHWPLPAAGHQRPGAPKFFASISHSTRNAYQMVGPFGAMHVNPTLAGVRFADWLADAPADIPFVMVACWAAGAPPGSGDSVAQLTADGSAAQRPFLAGTSVVMTARGKETGRPYTGLEQRWDHPAPGWATFR